jgi:hypothetical protein
MSVMASPYCLDYHKRGQELEQLCVVVSMEVAEEGEKRLTVGSIFGFCVARLPNCMGRQHTNHNI